MPKVSNIIKILISYHKPYSLLKNKIFVPVHVGRDVAMEKSKDGKIALKDYNWLIKNLIGDNTGENISYKNREWCELTAIYWAWKNYDKIGNPSFIGFMHYRRFFEFDNYKKTKDIENFVKKYDFIINQRCLHNENDQNNYNQYKLSKHHHIENLEAAIEIVKKLYPYYDESIEKYLKLDYGYYKNIFIMKKEIFFEYCKWLFSILEQLEKEIDITIYNDQEKRVFGYIAERLLGIFYTHWKNDIKTTELPLERISEINYINFNERIHNLLRKLIILYCS